VAIVRAALEPAFSRASPDAASRDERDRQQHEKKSSGHHRQFCPSRLISPSKSQCNPACSPDYAP